MFHLQPGTIVTEVTLNHEFLDEQPVYRIGAGLGVDDFPGF
jgi:hypothetical protein